MIALGYFLGGALTLIMLMLQDDEGRSVHYFVSAAIWPLFWLAVAVIWAAGELEDRGL